MGITHLSSSCLRAFVLNNWALWCILAGTAPAAARAETGPAGTQPAGAGGEVIALSWDRNILTLESPGLPGGRLKIWYLEAFCRRGSTHRQWDQTTIPFKTELVDADPRRRRLRLRTTVDDKVEVRHEIRSGPDHVDFQLEIENRTDKSVDIDWAQACIRIGEFTGRGQEDYFEKCFIFTDRGLTRMHETHRATEALYTPGQVYVPAGIDPEDVNPRPVSRTRPVNGLVGCFSADDKLLLAAAWSRTQELFQGIIKCIHSDFRIGGLAPKETKRLHGKIYIMPNDPQKLLERYRRDFAESIESGKW